MTTLFEDLLQKTYIDAHNVWELVKFMCNYSYGPNFSFKMGRNLIGKGEFYAEFGDFRSTSDNPVVAICRAASKAMDEG